MLWGLGAGTILGAGANTGLVGLVGIRVGRENYYSIELTYTSGAERAAAPISPYSGGPLSEHGSSGELGLYAYSMRQSPAKSPADDATKSASEA